MVRTPRVRLLLLGAAVAVVHVVGLEWLARQADQISSLADFTPPMYTRMLQPVAPPPVVDIDTPPANPRALQWGRWAPLLGEQATASLQGPAGAERILNGNFVLFRTAGDAYVASVGSRHTDFGAVTDATYLSIFKL